MNKQFAVILAFLFSLFFLNTAAAGESLSNSSPADELADHLRAISSLQGKFQQTLMADDGELLQESSGDFALSKKGQYRWETKDPFAQLLIGDKNALLLYDPDLEQLNRRRLTESEKQTPLFILSSPDLSIAEAYLVSKSEDTFRLLPKSVSSSFVSMDIRFVAQVPVEISVLDSLGQTTQIRLLDIDVNQTIDSTVFEFEAPQGTDIIDEG
ncbi:outer membrane lipoprotein chaperone LolA [uncultured Pseudoteredinibacter sp.]|uniref:outer membrane lipoprotein chaperone LolA n=1 Tax=uncultured Pseudoteredinibacter sp. TaxID=1641701 RepID=UPI0026161766|nr:outer membrane lipoprotein chaperone LolA [uncultured Pseudoteredinibacter sp.]